MAKRPSIGDYIETIKESAPRMLSDISELAKAELKPAAKHGGIGAGMFAAAGIFGAALLWILLLVAGFGIAIIFNQALGMSAVTSLCIGFGIIAALVLIIVAILALIGWQQVRKVKAPEMTIAETKASIKSISDAVSQGVQDAQDGHPGRAGLKAGQFPATSGVVAMPRPTQQTAVVETEQSQPNYADKHRNDITATDNWADAIKPSVKQSPGASRVEWK